MACSAAGQALQQTSVPFHPVPPLPHSTRAATALLSCAAGRSGPRPGALGAVRCTWLCESTSWCTLSALQTPVHSPMRSSCIRCRSPAKCLPATHRCLPAPAATTTTWSRAAACPLPSWTAAPWGRSCAPPACGRPERRRELAGCTASSCQCSAPVEHVHRLLLVHERAILKSEGSVQWQEGASYFSIRGIFEVGGKKSVMLVQMRQMCTVDAGRQPLTPGSYTN